MITKEKDPASQFDLQPFSPKGVFGSARPEADATGASLDSGERASGGAANERERTIPRRLRLKREEVFTIVPVVLAAVLTVGTGRLGLATPSNPSKQAPVTKLKSEVPSKPSSSATKAVGTDPVAPKRLPAKSGTGEEMILNNFNTGRQTIVGDASNSTFYMGDR